MKKLYFVLMMIFVANSFAQVTGQVRLNLINSAKPSCFQTQRMTAPTNIPDAAIKQYCNCWANYMADSLNNNQVAAIESGKMQMPQNIIVTGTEYFRANINKYPPS